MCASPWLLARGVRNHAHSSLPALYIVARFPAHSSFPLVRPIALDSASFGISAFASRLVSALVSSRLRSRLVSSPLASRLVSARVSSRLVSSPLCSRLVSSRLVSSPLCSRLVSSRLRSATPPFLSALHSSPLRTVTSIGDESLNSSVRRLSARVLVSSSTYEYAFVTGPWFPQHRTLRSRVLRSPRHKQPLLLVLCCTVVLRA
jgi:hypothetical protein